MCEGYATCLTPRSTTFGYTSRATFEDGLTVHEDGETTRTARLADTGEQIGRSHDAVKEAGAAHRRLQRSDINSCH